jgi:hypothetical protein
MPLVHHDGMSIFFAHVPKTGGSSVEDYLLQRFGALSIRQRPDAPRRQRDIIQSCSHLSAADLRHLLPDHLDLCFTVVRDPVRRIISEYGFQRGTSRISRLGFSFWLHAVLAAARRDPRIYENHIRPQGDLVPEGAEIFRLENGFAPVVARIDAVTGCTAPQAAMRHLLKRAGQLVTLTRQDVALIAAFYASDYDRFGYDLPELADLPENRFWRLRAILGQILGWLIVLKHRRAWIF